jgi:hypothetical protein
MSTTCLAETFQLKSGRNGNLYGPYEFKDGATVVIGKASFTLVKSEQAPSALEKKMNEIIIPKLQFREANIAHVLNDLRQASIDLDKIEIPSEQKGVNFILKGNPQDMPSVTLNLSSVSLADAVKFVTEIANLKYSYYKDVSVVFEAKK